MDFTCMVFRHLDRVFFFFFAFLITNVAISLLLNVLTTNLKLESVTLRN